MRKLMSPRVVERRADPLTQEDLRRLLAAISRYTLAGTRHHNLFALFADMGLRIGEMLRLQLVDLRLDDGYLMVRHGKGDKDRVVLLTAARVASSGTTSHRCGPRSGTATPRPARGSRGRAAL